MAVKKKRNRLTDVRCTEVAIVDRGAIGVPFMLYKRDEGGNDNMEIEELKKALEKANADLAEFTKKFDEQSKELVAMKEDLEKAKLRKQPVKAGTKECPTCGGSGADPKAPAKDCPDCGGTGAIKKSAMDEDSFAVCFQKSVDEVVEFDVEVAKVGRIFNSKNEAAIQSAYEALGKLLEAAKKRKDPIYKAMEEYTAATPERKKEMEQQLTDTMKKAGVDVTPYM